MAATKWYGQAISKQWGSTAADRVDWVSDTIKCVLLKSTYTPDQDAHAYYSDLTAASNEVSGTGYTAGGQALTGKSVSYDAASNEARLIASNPSWTGATLTGVRYAVLYKDTGTASTSKLLGWIDFTLDQAVTAGTFSVTLDTTGCLKVTPA